MGGRGKIYRVLLRTALTKSLSLRCFRGTLLRFGSVFRWIRFLDFPDYSTTFRAKIDRVRTDMVDGSGAELSEELFRAEGLQVVDDERPQMQDVVA